MRMELLKFTLFYIFVVFYDFFRRDSLPTGTFTKYTWNLTNLRHVQQIFDTTTGIFLYTLYKNKSNKI